MQISKNNSQNQTQEAFNSLSDCEKFLLGESFSYPQDIEKHGFTEAVNNLKKKINLKFQNVDFDELSKKVVKYEEQKAKAKSDIYDQLENDKLGRVNPPSSVAVAMELHAIQKEISDIQAEEILNLIKRMYSCEKIDEKQLSDLERKVFQSVQQLISFRADYGNFIDALKKVSFKGAEKAKNCEAPKKLTHLS